MLYWLILFQQTLASTTHIATHSLATQCDPFLVVLLRVGTATVVFVVVALIWGRRTKYDTSQSDLPHDASITDASAQKNTPTTALFGRHLLHKDHFWLLFALGLVNVPGSQALFAWGLKYTIPPNAALAYAMTPAFVLLISVVFLRERASVAKFIGVGIAFVGAFVALAERGVNLSSEYLLGNAIELGAALLWSVYTVLGRSAAEKYGALNGTTLGMVSGFVLYTPVYLAFEGVSSVGAQMAALTPSLWWQAAYLAVFATCGSFGLWFYAMSKMDAANVAVFMNLQPLITTLLTFLIWRTMPSLWFFAGAVLVVAGVLLTQREALFD